MTPVKISIAKLLKAKGFEQNAMKYINEATMDGTLVFPPIAEVIMWLYEKHGVWISVKGDDNKTFRYELHKWIWYEPEKTLRQAHVTFGGGIFDINSEEFNSPTEAYEEAIEYVLKEVIN